MFIKKNPKTLNGYELLGQNLLNITFRAWADTINSDLSVSFERLDIETPNGYLKLTGLVFIGGTIVRFKIRFDSYNLDSGMLRSSHGCILLSLPESGEDGEINDIWYQKVSSRDGYSVAMDTKNASEIERVIRKQLAH